MPIYMDVHIVPGIKAKDVAQAHRKDILLQEEHQCKCMTYWIDEERENVFCLIEAPNEAAVHSLHSRAHGLTPNKIIEVSSSIVESFLGRIYDPSDSVVTDDGLKVFHDPSFRTLMIIKMADTVLLKHVHGEEKVNEWMNELITMVRIKISDFGGTEVHGGSNIILSFTKAEKAFEMAALMNEMMNLSDAKELDLHFALHAGEPVNNSDKLFGDTIQLAEQMCTVKNDKKLIVSSAVKELINGSVASKNSFSISPQDEELIKEIYRSLEANLENEDFGVNEFCRELAMSKSQLYRKTTELFDLSPNHLIKEFRLEKARELMKKNRNTISEITFSCGFTSPSYFTKCFKARYGLLPMAYMELV